MKVAQTNIVQVAQQMPASPRILARLSEVLADVNSDTGDIVDLVKAGLEAVRSAIASAKF